MKTIAEQRALWRAVVDRDASKAFEFVYAVETTGVFCRTTCPSRRPKRENVRFFATPEEARRAGFRPCERCRPDTPADEAGPQTAAVLAACRFIAEHPGRIPTLRQLADHVGLSEGYLHRLFKRRLGLTPRAYADALRTGRLRESLRASDSVTRALYEAGYGSSSRVYDRKSARLGMTPGAYRRGAAGITIRYAVARCRLGHLLAAMTDRGVCFVALGDRAAAVERNLHDEFPGASLKRDEESVGAVLEPVLAFVEQGTPLPRLALDVQATAFQRRVWDCLQRVPQGETITYAALARAVDQPKAARAVAQACAANPAALVIPCHRAVRSDGRSGGYRWGSKRKAALLALEEAGFDR